MIRIQTNPLLTASENSLSARIRIPILDFPPTIADEETN